MFIQSARRTAALAIVTVLGAVALAGCAALPSAPQGAPGTIEARLVRAPESAGLVGDLLGGTTGTVTGLTQTTLESISGTLGGTVRTGRFSIVVPPGAFDGTGDISIDVPDSNALLVKLHITQVPNEFKVPVTLKVSYENFDGNPEADPSYYKIFWFDEEAGQWRMLQTVVDTKAKTVSTELEHFSTYGVLEAKAGW